MCACFPEILQNFTERQILWSLCLVLFLALTLKFPIKSSLSVAPELPFSLSLHEKCPNSTPQMCIHTSLNSVNHFPLCTSHFSLIMSRDVSRITKSKKIERLFGPLDEIVSVFVNQYNVIMQRGNMASW